MPYVITAKCADSSYRFVGVSEITQQLYWTESPACACVYHELMLARIVLDELLDDERHCNIGKAIAAFGLSRSIGRYTITFEVHDFTGTQLGEVMDLHVIHYQLSVPPRQSTTRLTVL